jgi:hypothetical protein
MKKLSESKTYQNCVAANGEQLVLQSSEASECKSF